MEKWQDPLHHFLREYNFYEKIIMRKIFSSIQTTKHMKVKVKDLLSASECTFGKMAILGTHEDDIVSIELSDSSNVILFFGYLDPNKKEE
jgi:hypothetical protein